MGVVVIAEYALLESGVHSVSGSTYLEVPLAIPAKLSELPHVMGA